MGLQFNFYEFDRRWRDAWAAMTPEEAEQMDRKLAAIQARNTALIVWLQQQHYQPPHVRWWRWMTRRKDEARP